MSYNLDYYAFLEKYQPFDQFSQFDQLNQHYKDVNLFGQTVKIGQKVGQSVRTPPTREAFGTALYIYIYINSLGHNDEPTFECLNLITTHLNSIQLTMLKRLSFQR